MEFRVCRNFDGKKSDLFSPMLDAMLSKDILARGNAPELSVHGLLIERWRIVIVRRTPCLPFVFAGLLYFFESA